MCIRMHTSMCIMCLNAMLRPTENDRIHTYLLLHRSMSVVCTMLFLLLTTFLQAFCKYLMDCVCTVAIRTLLYKLATSMYMYNNGTTAYAAHVCQGNFGGGKWCLICYILE